MLAHSVTCPNCRAELRLKAALPAGMTSAKCPQCGGLVPLTPVTHPASDTDASVADRTQSAPKTVPTTYPFLAPPRAPDEIGRLGPYRVLAELGRGGMGIVFRAEDPQLKRFVALKVMLPQYAADPAERARFVREARAQAQVEHDHVAVVYQVDEDRGVAYLAMPLLKGQSLADALRANPNVPLLEAVRIAREMAEGLAGAHEQGLVHRDIKPGNVWLEGKHRRVKILDFGLARTVREEKNAEVAGDEITRRGAVIGTPAYMSPEQARGESIDPRSDLFSLGVVLYQMLTGRQPFRGQSSTAILIAVATETPPRPSALNPGVPPVLDALAMALLAKDVGSRPPSADEVAATLGALEGGLGTGHTNAPGFVAVPVTVPAPDAPPDPWAAIDATEAGGSDLSVVVSPKTKRHTGFRGETGRNAGRRTLYLTAALFAFALAAVLTGAAIYVQTLTGALVVEINDAEVESRFRGGKLVLLGPDGKPRYTLPAAERNKSIATGAYTVRLEDVDGLTIDPREFALKRGEKVTVRITLTPKPPQLALPPPPPPSLDADRRAADYVVSVGGVVRVNGETRNIKVPADIPREAFRLTYVDLTESKATDLGLAAFQGCKSLNGLYITKAQVSDAGLAHFKDCTELAELGLVNMPFGNAGLAHFKSCKRLTHLNLYGTNAGDEGVAYFKDCKDELTTFNLSGTKVTDAGLAHYKGCKNLTFLNLSGTQATDAGLAHFKDNKNLGLLWLNNLPITDAGLAHFAECKALYNLAVGETKISDTGLAHFKNCAALSELRIWSTAATEAGLAHFKHCANLTLISISDTKIGDTGIEHLKGCTNLTSVYMWNTAITDAAVAHLAGCRRMVNLNVGATRVTDTCADDICRFEAFTTLDLRKTNLSPAGFAKVKQALPKCKIDWDGGTVAAPDPDRAAAEYVLSIGGRVRINGEISDHKASSTLPAAPFALTWASLLDNKRVTEAELSAFRGCRNLTYLSLTRTSIGDAGLVHFKDCTKLAVLHLTKTQVTDAGLLHFKECKELATFALGGTKITDAPLLQFQFGGSLTNLHLWETQVTDEGLVAFKNCKNLTTLGLSKTRITSAGLVHFKGCKELADLSLFDTGVGDEGLANFAGCTELTAVALSNTAVGNDGLAALKDCKKLSKLSLWASRVGDEGLAHLASCQALSSLSLNRTAVTDAGLAHLAGCEELSELHLTDLKITDAGLAHLKGCKNLSDLYLNGTQVSDEGIAHLKDARLLQKLRLMGTKITNATLTQLAAQKRLTFLDVRKTKVTAAALDELQRALPNCRVDWDGGTIQPKTP